MANAHHTAEQIRERINYNPETGIITWRTIKGTKTKVGQIAGNVHAAGYTRVRIDDVMYKAHRLAWVWMTGNWPSGIVDHINRNNADNRFCNLRVVTHKQNIENNNGQGYRSRSGVKGVYWHNQSKKWRSQICHFQKVIHIGLFNSIEEAQKARIAAELKYFTHSPACALRDESPDDCALPDETPSPFPPASQSQPL